MSMATLPGMRRKIVWLSVKLSSRAKRLMGMFKADEVDRILAELRAPGNYAELAGKVVVITGSSRGVGLALAKAFALKGAKVVINGRDAGVVENAAKVIRSTDAQVLGVAADVATAEGAKALLEKTIAQFGRVDILINNAGTSGPTGTSAWEIDPAEWERVVKVNLNGPYFCARYFTEWMVKNGVAGRIINVSTGATQGGQKDFTPYVASKCGMEAMAHNLAMDVGRSGIGVTNVRIGSVQTEMTKGAFTWEQYQLLPPADIVAPVFLHAATAPTDAVHGRTLASWRFLQDQDAELALNSNLALAPRFSFAPRAVPKDVPESEWLMLDRAENPFGIPGKVREYLANAAATAKDLHRYPAYEYPGLRAALSRKLKLPTQCFTFGNGSAEIVERVLRVFVPAGEEVITNDPNWFLFDRFAAIFGVENRKAPMLRDEATGLFHHNLDGILALIGPRTRMIYLVTPSNPVGTTIRHDAFMAFIQKVPAHIPVIVDEAYVDFADPDGMLNLPQAVQQTDRMVIGLRTFSKFYGLAGFRIGYGFGGEKGINLLNRLEMPFNIPTLTAGAAEAALTDDEHAAKVLANFRTERARLEKFLRDFGLDFVPTQMNVMLAECPGNPEAFYKRADERGIYNPKGIWMGKFTSLPISLPEHNDRNMALWSSFM